MGLVTVATTIIWLVVVVVVVVAPVTLTIHILSPWQIEVKVIHQNTDPPPGLQILLSFSLSSLLMNTSLPLYSLILIYQLSLHSIHKYSFIFRWAIFSFHFLFASLFFPLDVSAQGEPIQIILHHPLVKFYILIHTLCFNICMHLPLFVSSLFYFLVRMQCYFISITWLVYQ